MIRGILVALVLAMFWGHAISSELCIPLRGENEVVDPYFRHLHVDSQGRIYIADRHASRILVFSPDGQRIAAFGRKGEGPGDFKRWFGSFALSRDDRVLQIDFWGGNRSISCFSPLGEFLWQHKIQKSGNFGPANIYPVRDGSLILEIDHTPVRKSLGEMQFAGSKSSFYRADESGMLSDKLASVDIFYDFTDQSGRGWPAMPYRVNLLSAWDAASNRLAYQKSSESSVHIQDGRDGAFVAVKNGFEAQALSTELLRKRIREMMTQRGREAFIPLYKKLEAAGATVETHIPIVSALLFTDTGDLLIGSNEDNEDSWTVFILDAALKRKGPYSMEVFPSEVRKGQAYFLKHDEEDDVFVIHRSAWNPGKTH